jgi:hypothetical protein
MAALRFPIHASPNQDGNHRRQRRAGINADAPRTDRQRREPEVKGSLGALMADQTSNLIHGKSEHVGRRHGRIGSAGCVCSERQRQRPRH